MFKRSVLACSLVAFSAISVRAQVLTIHGSTQKQAYASPAEWLTVDSQCHWVPGDGSPAIDPPNTLTHDMAHVHVGPTTPLYAEVSGPVQIPVSFKLFHTAGRLVIVQAYILSMSGRQQIPLSIGALPVQGNPSGLVTINGTVTMDPNAGLSAGIPRHGWFELMIFARVQFDNGQSVDAESFTSYYSVIDPALPENPLPADGINLGTRCGTNVSGGVLFGAQIVEFREVQPLFGTLTGPVTFHGLSYAYAFTPNQLPNGSYELIEDADLHMGVAGTTLVSKPNVSPAGTENRDTLDPAVLDVSTAPMGYPAHKHKMLFSWNQPGPVGSGFLMKTLMAFDVTVDPGGTLPPPPPQPCAGLVGQTGTVTIGSVPFKVTVTSDTCSAMVVTF